MIGFKMASSIYRKKENRKDNLDTQRSMVLASRRGRQPPEETQDPLLQLKQEVHKTYKVINDLSTAKERWRKSEDTVLPTFLKACSKINGKLDTVSSIDTEDFVKLSEVFSELSKLLDEVQHAFIDTEDHIFEEEELAKKYYEHAAISILEVWASCNAATTSLMDLLQRRDNDNSDHNTRLMKSISLLCSSCAKLVSVTINPEKHPLPDGLGDNFLSSATTHATTTSESLTKLLKSITSSTDDEADDTLLESITWILCSLNHVASKAVKPNKTPEGSNTETGENSSGLTTSLNQLFESLDALKKQLNSSSTTGTDNEENKEKGEKEKFEDCSKAIEHLEEEYRTFLDTVMSSGNLSICITDPSGSDASIYYKPELYHELAGYYVGPCDMKDRSSWLNEIQITEDQKLVSDIFISHKTPLKTSEDVEVDFSIVPSPDYVNKKIIIRIKSDGQWKDLEDSQQEISESDAHVSFKTSNLEAFVAYIEIPSDDHEVTPEGSTYTSPANPEIQVVFPPGTVKETQTFKLKVAPYDYRKVGDLKEKYPDAILGIVSISDAVEMWTKSDVSMLKNMFVQLPLDDDDDGDTQLVVIRYRGNQIQILDKSQCHVKKDNGLYKVESRGIWSIAVAKIKKIFLNMRDTVKREFQIIFGKVQLCNICTFIDNTQRDMETGSFFLWIECIDKGVLKEDLEEKKKMGFTEIKNSRSKDLSIRQHQTLILTVDGQVRIRDPDPPENFRITYLNGADNHLNIPMEVRRADQDKLPYAILAFCEEGSDNTFHVVNIPVRDLAELPTDDLTHELIWRQDFVVPDGKTRQKNEEEITARQLTKASESNNIREAMKKKEEAAKNMLSHQSLMTLSRYMTDSDGWKLGVQLGVPLCKIEKLKEASDDDVVRTNFQILCEWRGTVPRSAMVDFLVSSFRTIARNELAGIITNVRKYGRGLMNSDFV